MLCLVLQGRAVLLAGECDLEREEDIKTQRIKRVKATGMGNLRARER